MTPAQAWRRLGIAATDDVRAIRRAYAAKLKRLDVDADPRAFEQLRAARDQALWLAQQPNDGDDWDEPAAAGEEDPPPLEVAPDPFAIEVGERHPATPTDPYDAHAGALYELLHAEPAEVPLGSDLDAAEAELAALLADPGLEQIDRYTRLEEWAAMLLADTTPRSDQLLERAAARFGWRQGAGRVDERWWVRQVNDRIDALDYRARLAGGSHALSRAWRELTRPVDGDRPVRRNLFVRRGQVDQLLKTIRGTYPSLEAELVEPRVAAWEGANRWGCSSTWILAVIAIQVVLAVARCDREPDVSPPVVVPAATDPYTAALAGFDPSLTPVALQAAQPALADELRPLAARADGVERVIVRLNERTGQGLAVASPALVREYGRQQLANLSTVQRRAPTQCDAYLRGKSVGDEQLDRQLVAGLRRIAVRIVLTARVPAGADVPDGGFRFGGALLKDAVARSKLTREQLSAALNGDGPPRDQCTARMATIDAALAAGDAGLPVLRAM